MQVDPECDRLLVQTAVELIRELFAQSEPIGPAGWLASGRLRAAVARPPLRRPAPAPEG